MLQPSRVRISPPPPELVYNLFMEEFSNTNKEGSIEKSTIKEGVDFVFEQNPELEKAGTKEQYSEYLDTIFPESKIRNIVYHASPNKFEKFKDPSSSGLSHIWFSEKPLKYQFGEKIYAVLINLKNPISEFDPNYREEMRMYESPVNPDWANNYHITGCSFYFVSESLQNSIGVLEIFK